jgi:ATP-dependent DNA helicase RecG
MLKETQHIEFKPKFNEDVIETLVAFANTKGGKVLVGVDDKGKPVKNFTIGKESIQNWINEVKTKTQPQIIPDGETETYKGAEIVSFSVQEYPIKPIACKGKYFKRVNNSNHLLSVTEVVNMHLQTLNTSWDAYPDAVHKLGDISFEKVEQAMEEMRKNGLTIKENPLEFLEKHDLLRDGKLTNAAYLLFTKKDTYLTTIELGRFQDNITIKDSARTKSDILTQIELVMDFVRKHANKRMIFTGEARRIEKWQYPMEAIREIVINMIIHRDYRSSSDSIVKIYDNKIEFYNPGRLPEDITIEKLLSGQYKSTPRNKIIAGICKDMHLIEKYGSGIGRVRDYFKEESSPDPTFGNISEGFQVTVFGNEFFNETENDIEKGLERGPEKGPEKGLERGPEKGPEKVTVNQQKIVDTIRNNPFVTREELVEIVGISLSKIKENIAKLKTKGLIERVGSDKGGYWKISEGSQVTVFGNEFFNETENDIEKEPERGPEKGPEKVTVNQQKIVDTIRNNPFVTREELVEIVGISLSKIKENIAKLKAKGLIERVGPDKGGHWRILDDNKMK